jgi:recombination protein RecA
MFNQGISLDGDLLETGVKLGIVEKAGAFYSYSGTKLGQGKMKTMAFLQANADLAMEIETVIKNKVEAKKAA